MKNKVLPESHKTLLDTVRHPHPDLVEHHAAKAEIEAILTLSLVKSTRWLAVMILALV